MEADQHGEVTVILQQLAVGRADVADRLVPLVMDELHRLAISYLQSERSGHTLQATALVNEAYLRLVGDQARDWRNRAHFIGVTASIMRRILVDHARRRRAAKRDPGAAVPGEANAYNQIAIKEAEELIALSDALDRLEKLSSRQRHVVEMRYFGGLSAEETAEVLGISLVTVKRDWSAARAWLRQQLRSVSDRDFS